MFKSLWVWLNCKINKILALLSIMIIILLFTCANAKVLTDIEIKNFILNGYKTKINSNVPANIQNNVLYADFSSWISLMEVNEGHYGIQLSSNGQQAILYIISGSSSNLQNYFPYSNGSSFLVNTNYIRTDYYSFTLASGTFGSKVNGSGWLFSNPRTWWYIDTNIKINSSNQTSNGTNLYIAPYSEPANAFDENWLSSIKWELIPNSSQQITIPNKTQQFYTMNKGSFNTTLATLQDSSYTDQIMMLIQAYNGTSWEVVIDRELYNNTMIISDTFPSQTDSDTLKSQIQVKSNTIPANSIIILRAYPNQYIANELGITEIEEYFYITNNKTVITGNTLDLVGTFSGDTDYENEVNQAINNEQQQTNDNNLQDIVNDLTNDSEVGGIINSELSQFNSGDLGYVEYENPFGEFVFGFFEGACNTLLDSGDVVIDLSHHGQNWQLRSGDFRLPSNALTTFVRTLMTFVVVYMIYKFFYFIIHALQTADFSKLKNNIVDQDMKDINLL